MDEVYSSFNTLEKQRLIDKPHRECISARRVFAIMAFLGFSIAYSLQANLDVAILTMAQWAEDVVGDSPDRCSSPGTASNTTNKNHDAEFDWNATTQRFVLDSFFYGYIATHLLGGWLAFRFGGKPVFGVAIFLAAVMNFLSPVAARYNVYLFIVIRVVGGLCQGVLYPAIHSMLGQWSPKAERSRWTAFVYSGSLCGGAVTWACAGHLIDIEALGGWPSVFYIAGLVASIWVMLWLYPCLVFSTPAKHPRISREEKELIEESQSRLQDNVVPWSSIVTSLHVWGICVAQMCAFWMFYTFVMCVPIYLITIHDIDIESYGWWTAVPYIALCIVIILVGLLADKIQSKGYLSTTNTRKMMTTIGLLVPASLLIICGYVGCEKWLVISLLIIAFLFFGFVYGGFFVNHLDIAPRFAGILMGLSMGLGTIPALVVPIFVDYLRLISHSTNTWQTIFLINGCVSVFGCAVYNTFCTGEEQPWANRPMTREERNRERRNRKVDNWFVDSTDLA